MFLNIAIYNDEWQINDNVICWNYRIKIVEIKKRLPHSFYFILYIDNFYSLILVDSIVVYLPIVIIDLYGNLLKYIAVTT